MNTDKFAKNEEDQVRNALRRLLAEVDKANGVGGTDCFRETAETTYYASGIVINYKISFGLHYAHEEQG